MISLSFMLSKAQSVSTWCNDPFECSNITVIDDIVYAEAYKSNHGIHSKMKCDNCWCEGAYACAFASMIEAIGVDKHSEGAGDGSASGATVFLNAEDCEFGCSAVSSCANSLMYGNDTLSQTRVACNSDYSCANAIIKGVKTVSGFGFRCLVNATIYSHPSLEVTMWSGYAGYNATVYCQPGHECHVSCQGNGCLGMKFECIGNATCTIKLSDTHATYKLTAVLIIFLCFALRSETN